MSQWFYQDADGQFRWHSTPGEARPTHMWPMASDALGVCPHQIKDFQESARRDGVSTDFTPTGEPILTSHAHRRRYLRHRGFHDNCSYL